MEGNYDCIVVGAGIEGSGAAFQLARMGVSTVLLEQFPLPHSRGSSSGPSRVIRRAYTHKFYAEMMDEAYDWWHRIAAETDTALYKKCGMLTISDDDHEIQGTKKTMEDLNMPYEYYNTAIEIRTKYPMFRVQDNYKGVYDPDAGTLMADKCLRCLQVTPDEVCIIDRHPQHPNVIFAAGFSGSGFKLAPVLGKVLAEMVLGCKTSYDTTPFSMRRFQAKSRL